jgi:hypothetical protein
MYRLVQISADVMSSFSAAEAAPCRPQKTSQDPVVLVPEGTVEMWEQLLADESCADVELEVRSSAQRFDG